MGRTPGHTQETQASRGLRGALGSRLLAGYHGTEQRQTSETYKKAKTELSKF